MADLICESAHAVKQATGGRKLVLFFYGYLFEFADLQMAGTNSGHYDLRKVLDCPDIDFLCSPISYYDRSTDGTAPAMTAAESVALAGKIWVMEDDTSTHLSLTYINPPGAKDRTHSLEETNEVLMRNDVEVESAQHGDLVDGPVPERLVRRRGHLEGVRRAAPGRAGDAAARLPLQPGSGGGGR